VTPPPARPLDEVDLSADPFDDNLDEELQARAPRNLTSRTTVSLAAAVLVVGGFLGGVLVQKNFGTTKTTSSSASAPAGGFGNFAGGGRNGGNGGTGGTGGAGGSSAAGGGAPSTTGKVTLVDGATVYVTTADGQVVIVHTSANTVVKVEQTGALKDIPVGTTVSVQGATGADGSVAATQVTAQK
jgi:hypothetical protein